MTSIASDTSIAEMSLDEIRKRGLEALARALGPAGMIRFLQQFDNGSGDYTAERHQWLSDDIDEILQQMKSNSAPTKTE